MTTDLLIGIFLTLVAYAGLIWAVVHGKHVIEQVKRGQYSDHPNPKHRPEDRDAEDRDE